MSDSSNPFVLGTGLETSEVQTPTDDNPFVLGDGSEPKEEPKVGRFESLARGGTQGVTLGFGDEASGAVDRDLNSINDLAYKLGLTDRPSPMTIAKQLKEQGFTGDIGPSTPEEVYSAGRDEERKRNDLAFKQNPGSFVTGTLAGGLATMPLVPTKALAPMTVATEASLLAKAGVGAVNSLPLGATIAAGTSNADLTQGEVPEFLKETATGAAIGAGIGAAIPVAGAGANFLANKAGLNAETLENTKNVLAPMVPDKIKKAWTSQRERGFDMANPNNYDNQTLALNEKAKDLTKLKVPEASKVTQTAKELENSINENQNVKKQIAASTDENVNAIEKQKIAIKNNLTQEEQALDDYLRNNKIDQEKALDDITEQAKAANRMQEALQTTQNRQEALLLEKRLGDSTVKLQSSVGKAKSNIKDEYETIENVIASEHIPVDNRNVISNLELELEDSGIPREIIDRLMKKLKPSLENNGFDQHLKMKTVLNEMRNHVDFGVRKAAGNAYRAANENIVNTLNQAGKSDLANKLSQTNRKYSALMDIEDGFVGNTKPDRLTGQMYVDPMTSKTIGAFQGKNVNQTGGIVPEFVDKLGIITPEAPQIVNELQDLASAQVVNKTFKPQTTPVPEMLAQNPEYVKRQQILEQYKRKAYEDATTRAKQAEIQSLKQKMSGLESDATLLQESNKIAQTNADQAIKSAQTDLNTLGLFDSTKKRLIEIIPKMGQKTPDRNVENELVDLINTVSRENGPEAAQAVEKQLTDLATDMSLTNYNKNVKWINPVYWTNQAAKSFPKTPQQFTDLAAKIGATQTSTAQQYSKQLAEAANKSDSSKTALMFQLMQQSAFRKLYNPEDSGNSDK